MKGSLPDLQFKLESAGNPLLMAEDFRGKVALVFFGYAHCPDICPTTMARLGAVLRTLGDSAQGVRILFISVDPKRDTPDLLSDYVQSFSPQAVGATGNPEQIESLARRYRVAYQETPIDAAGNYQVMHSKVVYVFDREGQVQLMITEADSSEAIVHDLKQLLHS